MGFRSLARKVRNILNAMLFIGLALYGAYFMYHNCKVAVFECAEPVYVNVPGQVIYRNQTEYINKTEYIDRIRVIRVTEPSDEPSPDGPPEPTRYIRVVQRPKYVEDVDYTADIFLSQTPVTVTPYSGSGVPYLIVIYKAGPYGLWGFNDTGMLHIGTIIKMAHVGYDLCESDTVRFLSWGATWVNRTETNRSVSYWSQPVPEDPYDLLGSGNNCYTWAFIESRWYVRICVETDGVLNKYREWSPDGNRTIYQYHDFTDACFTKEVKAPV